MKNHELINLEIVKESIGELPNHQNIFHRRYFLHIKDKIIPISQYELDLLFKSIQPYYKQNEEIVED